jgi:Mor family transcriptional regulator
VIEKMSTEITFAKIFRQNPLVVNEGLGIKGLEEVPNQIQTHQLQSSGSEKYDPAMAVFALSLGSSPLPENNLESLLRHDRREMMELITGYADYFESISQLDATLRDMSEHVGLFHEYWSNFGSDKLRLVVDTVCSRKKLWCSMEKEP